MHVAIEDGIFPGALETWARPNLIDHVAQRKLRGSIIIDDNHCLSTRQRSSFGLCAIGSDPVPFDFGELLATRTIGTHAVNPSIHLNNRDLQWWDG